MLGNRSPLNPFALCNFGQTPWANGRRLCASGGTWSGESVMSKADEFRQYAEEAMGWARDSKDEKQRAILINLARTWVQAAANQERPSARHDQAA